MSTFLQCIECKVESLDVKSLGIDPKRRGSVIHVISPHQHFTFDHIIMIKEYS